jgi:hypothetical protein
MLYYILETDISKNVGQLWQMCYKTQLENHNFLSNITDSCFHHTRIITSLKRKAVPVLRRGGPYIFPVRYEHHLHKEWRLLGCYAVWLF